MKFIKEIIQMNEIEIPITVWIYNLLWIYTLFYYLSDFAYNLLLLTKSCIFFVLLCSILMNTSVHITRNFNWKNSKRSCVNILLSKESYKVSLRQNWYFVSPNLIALLNKVLLKRKKHIYNSTLGSDAIIGYIQCNFDSTLWQNAIIKLQ